MRQVLVLGAGSQAVWFRPNFYSNKKMYVRVPVAIKIYLFQPKIASGVIIWCLRRVEISGVGIAESLGLHSIKICMLTAILKVLLFNKLCCAGTDKYGMTRLACIKISCRLKDGVMKKL